MVKQMKHKTFEAMKGQLIAQGVPATKAKARAAMVFNKNRKKGEARIPLPKTRQKTKMGSQRQVIATMF